MTHNIYDIANELERSIRQLPEYQAVVASKALIDENATAKEILDNYVAFQQSIQQQLQAGQLPDDSMQEKIQHFNQQIQKTPLLTDYFSKQQHLAVYIADLEKIIFKPLNDLL